MEKFIASWRTLRRTICRKYNAVFQMKSSRCSQPESSLPDGTTSLRLTGFTEKPENLRFYEALDLAG